MPIAAFGDHAPGSSHTVRDREPTAMPLPGLLSRLQLFRGLTPDQLRAVAAGCRFVALDRGEIVFHQGDPVRGFFFVLRGQVQITVSTPDGARKVMEIIREGEGFGEAVVFEGIDYPVTATALARTELLAVSSAAVLGLLDRDPGFARRMLANMAGRLRGLVQDVKSYSLRSSAQRVVGLLLSEAEAYGTPRGEVRLPARKQVLASRLNLAPETFSRVLHDLSADGLISVDGHRITLHDVPRLAARLE
ncbi:Crp/Fnr family transcriptional regulator [Actinorugispora endophytica]|uniref:CRP-like cAMP-binding protein n=1 Tax=Actinorugispora endophytica TaxID=1605990 RepID=A0A4R6V556_9ACTN|nr:Crp/Fnr family transcriptional regulator [Actinorugispora endophytica]TDQ55444.1 CRP-like cAMP-binding protein [Actinorugispora endophytica]